MQEFLRAAVAVCSERYTPKHAHSEGQVMLCFCLPCSASLPVQLECELTDACLPECSRLSMQLPVRWQASQKHGINRWQPAMMSHEDSNRIDALDGSILARPACS